MYSHDGLELPWPNNPSKEKFPILVYGASTNTGLWAVQYAKLSGLRVLATCSEKNFEAVKALGADELFDYKDEKCGEKIKGATGGKLMYAFDCVSEGNSKDVSCCLNLPKTLDRQLIDIVLPDLRSSTQQRPGSQIRSSPPHRVSPQRRQDLLHLGILSQWRGILVLWEQSRSQTARL